MYSYSVFLYEEEPRPTAYDVYEALRDAGLNPARVVPITDEDGNS